MTPAFTLLACLTVASAVAAMGLRNLVHCALALALAFAGLAGLYLQLDAQFVGLAQVLVYIGAVAILVMFAILLTRSGENPGEPVLAPAWAGGVAVVVVTFGVIAWCILNSPFSRREAPEIAPPTVQQIGEALMTRLVLPLEVIALLLTAAMIGAVIIAMQPRGGDTGGDMKRQASASPPSSSLPASSPGGSP